MSSEVWEDNQSTWARIFHRVITNTIPHTNVFTTLLPVFWRLSR